MQCSIVTCNGQSLNIASVHFQKASQVETALPRYVLPRCVKL